MSRSAVKGPAHRQTGYVCAAPLAGPEVLPLPSITTDLDQARSDLTELGMCFVADVLDPAEVALLRDKLSEQAQAERNLGELAPAGAEDAKQIVSNMVNKGEAFLSLVEHPLTDALAGYMLGGQFLLSSLTGHLFNAPTTEPQVLHRDQGQVPATVDFPAACNLFWLLDDFTPEDGSTYVVPGSHRWPAEHQIRPPARELAVQFSAPAGSVFAWDGRVWHGTGVNTTGSPRRNVAVYCCLPWMRQQENWGVTCLQEVLDEASPKLRARLGLRSYGTLGGMNGTGRTYAERTLGSTEVNMPLYIIGENGRLHPLTRVSRDSRPPAGD
jgi:ectoine hydroxylase-related dioxygenase (phytanoyl-CoA dioxygenase family)